MGGHQIRDKVLLFPDLPVHFPEFFCKCFVDAVLRLAHEGEHRGGYVLRGHFQLAADMIPAEFAEKFPLPVGQQIIKPDAGTDKYLLYTGNVTELFSAG